MRPKQQIFSYLSLFLFVLSSCKNEETDLRKEYDPSAPVVLTSFYPLEGGAKDKILLNGENFGSDPKAIKVYFNKKEAAVVSSSGNRIYAIVPRLPGDDPRISVRIGEDSVVYENHFIYTAQAQVTTVTGSGDREFVPGTLDQAHVCAKYLELDKEGNLFMTWRDGVGNEKFGVGRVSEAENLVTSMYLAASSPYPYANGITVDRETGMMTVSHESVVEVFFSFDPREGWYPRQRNASFADPHGIPTGNQYMNFISFSPYDGYLYTRSRDGSVVRIHPDTYEATVIHKGSNAAGSKWPYGSQYGQGINPDKPWELWMTLHSNASPNEYRQGLMVLDLRPEHINEGFKRVNATGGSGHRDGPIEDAVFNYPKDIKFDNDGNMFVADYGNHCIRMVSADGIVTTVAGQPGVSGYKDGGPIESMFNNPWGVAVNEDGDIYIADYGNSRIRKLVIE
ncbi:hypothetical protein FAZ19_04465 [Sphingobacterium alkalisoli]|uniref:IPT/TIG domain-containing protein n=1 Tax=Sphingobacterium alkalisoli TaxID=1874115 RepID=A0A4U0HAU4_9SPHI|nr:IPT/TIG domain-containing protein [Sphingobacterium alkalisoli]TJY68514.1 hypothetical protein FAZ19_04465 [Sphingobacterium alkalisoli]GGH05959.1 hypothetical protein GCM10011418_02430 [Sphingobacterium alkalisoli]